jgi:hypothetical protein
MADKGDSYKWLIECIKEDKNLSTDKKKREIDRVLDLWNDWKKNGKPET